MLQVPFLSVPLVLVRLKTPVDNPTSGTFTLVEMLRIRVAVTEETAVRSETCAETVTFVISKAVVGVIVTLEITGAAVSGAATI